MQYKWAAKPAPPTDWDDESYIGRCRNTSQVKKPFQTRPTSLGTKKSPGFCVTCSAVATTEALFKLEDAIVIQRYCDKCLPNAEY